MFEISLLTGHVRIRTRRELERLAASVPQASTPGALKEIDVLVACDSDGYLAVDVNRPTDERYIVVSFMSVDASLMMQDEQSRDNVGSTFDLAALWPGGLPAGISYYLFRNLTGRDINVVLDAVPQLRPADTVVKAGACREASLYVGETGHVLTISDELIDVES